MKLNRLVPTLWVSDIEQTISFYRNVLGFECANRMEGWACLVNHES
jgi:catechol 2,3-dioxygenase-like lactoylglutathione lyase family enzyme